MHPPPLLQPLPPSPSRTPARARSQSHHRPVNRTAGRIITSPGHLFHHVFPAMHTRFSLVLPGVDPTTGETLGRQVEALVRAQDRLLNRFDARSPVAELNRRAAWEPVAPPPAVWDLLQNCREHWQRTGGAFDIAQTARTDLYRESAARGTPPSETDRATAALQSGFHHVQFNTAARTVGFATPGLQLDFGAIGKGLALELAAQALRHRGVRCAFLSFGESSIAVIGAHPAGPFWPVGVADLFQPGRSWHRFELRDAAMSTSGNRTASGHIINPHDGQLLTGPRTLSVACPSAVDAEVLSTALLVVPPPDRAALLRNYPETQAVEIGYDPDNNGWTGRITWRHES
jgi:FAD:protein FMN transferase